MSNSLSYMGGRKKYSRPQALLFSDNPGTVIGGSNIPTGVESGAGQFQNGNFMILSDDNRGPISFNIERIEKRERMVNGRMRSHHIADKLSLSVSWTMLPSRSFRLLPGFDQTSGNSQLVGFGSPNAPDSQYTTDGGAGGGDLLEWYENNKGPFWVFLAYDKFNNFSTVLKYEQLNKYNQVIEMFISDFSYSVQKRGKGHDLWDVSISLEEV